MEVFISWSGRRSHSVADALRAWLPRVIQAIDPWLSSADIEAGAKWHQELGHRLASCNFGIICVTPENCSSRWLLYEAGGLSKSVEQSRVIPYLISLRKADVDGPLSHFQMAEAHREGTWEILKAINSALDSSNERAISKEELRVAFDVWWPQLDASLAEASTPTAEPEAVSPQRDPNDMALEVVENTRDIARRLESLIQRLPQDRVQIVPKKFEQYVPEAEVAQATRQLIAQMLPDLEGDATQTSMLEAIEKWRKIVADQSTSFEQLNDALREAKGLRSYLDR
jgi:hypothetical protein